MQDKCYAVEPIPEAGVEVLRCTFIVKVYHVSMQKDMKEGEKRYEGKLYTPSVPFIPQTVVRLFLYLLFF
jgi:hypothetical protein